MLTLGLDTALQSCAVAVLNGDQILARIQKPLTKGHAEVIAPMAREALSFAGVTIKSLDRVGVVVGPGGFTGVRVGLAFARGLALGASLQVIGVNALEALIETFRSSTDCKGLFAPVVDARRGDVFSALYDSETPIAPAFCDRPEQALDRLRAAAAERPVTMIGGGAQLLPPPPAQWRRGEEGDLQIDPVVVARIAMAAPVPTASPSPIYLRAPDAAPGGPSLFEQMMAP